MMRPTPVHRPVWRAVHDAVYRDAWVSEGGGSQPFLINNEEILINNEALLINAETY